MPLHAQVSLSIGIPPPQSRSLYYSPVSPNRLCNKSKTQEFQVSMRTLPTPLHHHHHHRRRLVSSHPIIYRQYNFTSIVHPAITMLRSTHWPAQQSPAATAAAAASQISCVFQFELHCIINGRLRCRSAAATNWLWTHSHKAISPHMPPQPTQVFSIHYSLHLATSMKTQRVPSLRDCKTEPLLVCSPWIYLSVRQLTPHSSIRGLQPYNLCDISTAAPLHRYQCTVPQHNCIPPLPFINKRSRRRRLSAWLYTQGQKKLALCHRLGRPGHKQRTYLYICYTFPFRLKSRLSTRLQRIKCFTLPKVTYYLFHKA